ncbi:Nucleobindin-2-like [Oopsacas minuta]|uniref:Nucleobindin-2-like n=1 Tax=Oopsacas minuta TaxID=111878 RepID=A0AAV7JIQ8_9METZ|nr:Nucleobindin-2-like [Oopsacas minuta]
MLKFLVILSIVSYCYSAPMRGETGNTSVVDKNIDELKLEPDTVPIQKLVPAIEHLPGINKLNLASEYNRYVKELKPFSELNLKDREDLAKNDQKTNGLRSKLDEVKRQLIESQRVDRRLVMLEQMQNEKDFRLDGLEHFGEAVQKLEKKKKKEDELKDQLKDFDAERRRKYFRVEKQQKLSQKDKLRLLAETERLKEENKLLEENEKKEIAKLNHPGSREHLESVWTESDGFDKGTFTPIAFFRLHDKNSDNYLDILEIEAFFIPEVRKIYGSHELNYEAREELALMREHLMPEIDLNHDELVSLDEFLSYTSSNERFNSNEGWQTLDQFDHYSQEDLKIFEEQRLKNEDSYDYYDYLEPLENPDYEDYSDE